MPKVIQDADRHATIDHPRTEFAGQVFGRSILPGTGEHHDLVRESRWQTSERANQVVHVLAHTGALAKGGSIVDEDPHVVSRLVAR
jgi:hypothetical protein